MQDETEEIMEIIIFCMWILLVLLAIILFYCYTKWEAGHFKRKGMKNLSFDYPLVGNMFGSLTFKEHLKESFGRVYKAFPNEKYVGYKLMNLNLIIIRDIDLLKQITMKDFGCFTDHLVAITENHDDLFGKNLFAVNGDKWRAMRATLSPAFTSLKMKRMFQFIVDIGKQMTEYYVNQSKQPEFKGVVEVELKDAFSRYTNDVITTSALGFKVDSFAEKSNIFYESGKDASDLTGLRFIKFLIFSSFPRLRKIFSLQLFPEKIKRFFWYVILQTIKDRTKKGIVRKDMIYLMMKAKEGTLKPETTLHSNIDTGFSTVQEEIIYDDSNNIPKIEWTDADMVAQALIFFTAGFETSSTLLTFMAHELTVNPEIQKKLQKEVDAVQLNEAGHLEYDALMKMNYMDMVVSESLRKWPPNVFTDRKCVKQYTLPPPSDDSTKECTIYEGESIVIPVYSIHNDPKYYPNPHIFDPERFSDENKSRILPSSYIPFGIGPRNCIGSRFALIESKVIMFYMLKKFDLIKIPKTDDPVKISPRSLNLKAVNGFWIGLKPRS